MKSFELDPQLKQDTFLVADLPLSQLLLMNDKRFPWFILVPRRANISEWFELTSEEQKGLLEEMIILSEGLKHFYKAQKMNIGALGNKVSQLHVHLIARFREDAAWPQSVWNFEKAVPYLPGEAQKTLQDLGAYLHTCPLILKKEAL